MVISIINDKNVLFNGFKVYICMQVAEINSLNDQH